MLDDNSDVGEERLEPDKTSAQDAGRELTADKAPPKGQSQVASMPGGMLGNDAITKRKVQARLVRRKAAASGTTNASTPGAGLAAKSNAAAGADASAGGDVASSVIDDPGGWFLRVNWAALELGTIMTTEILNGDLFGGVVAADRPLSLILWAFKPFIPSDVASAFELAKDSLAHFSFDFTTATLSVSAKRVSLKSFNYGGFLAAKASFFNLAMKYDCNSAGTLTMSSMDLADAVFYVDNQPIKASSIGLVTLSAAADGVGGGLWAALSIGRATIKDLQYPGAPPTDLDVKRANLSLYALHSLLAGDPLDQGAVANKPLQAVQPNGSVGFSALPNSFAVADATAYKPSVRPELGGEILGPVTSSTPQVLPEGARVSLSISDLKAAATLGEFGGRVEGFGAGSIGELSLKLVKGEDELASIDVKGFKAIANSVEVKQKNVKPALFLAASSISVKGSPGLVTALLAQQEITQSSDVQRVLDLVTASGIRPTAAGGKVTLENAFLKVKEGVSAGVDEYSAGGNLAADVDVPSVGKASVKINGFSAKADVADGEQSQASGGFASFEATLHDKKGRQAAHLVVTGVKSTGTASGAAVDDLSLKIQSVAVQGATTHLTALYAAIESQLTSLPSGVVQVFAALRRYGLAAGAAGSATLYNLTVDKDGAALAVRGNVVATVALPGGGRLDATLVGFSGSAGSEASMADFVRFEAKLADAQGGTVATFAVEGDPAQQEASYGDGRNMSFAAKKVEVTGTGANLKKLMDAFKASLGEVPPALVTVYQNIEAHLVLAETATALTLTDAVFSKQDGNLEMGANLAAAVAIDDVGELAVSVNGFKAGAKATPDDVGKMTAGDFASKAVSEYVRTIDSADITLTSCEGKPLAAIHVGGVERSAQGGAAGASSPLAIGQVTVTGDTKLLKAALSSPKLASLGLPSEVLSLLDLVGDFSLLASGMTIAQDAEGYTGTVDQLAVTGALLLVGPGGTTYECENADLLVKQARVKTGADLLPKEIGAGSLSAKGIFKSGGVSVDAVVTAGAAKVLFGAKGSVTSVEASELAASGKIIGLVGETPAADDQPTTKAEDMADAEALSQQANTAASLVKDAHIHADVPMNPGRYGRGFTRVQVANDTHFKVQVVIKDRTLVAELSEADFAPALRAVGNMFGITGAQVKAIEGQGKLRVELGRFATSIFNIVGENATGKERLALDLTTLISDLMAYYRQLVAEDDPKEDEKQQAWNDKKHDKWQEKYDDKAVDADVSGDELEEMRETEPRSPYLADAFYPGIGLDLMGTAADASLSLAPKGGKDTEIVPGVMLAGGGTTNLVGKTSGGPVINLAADNVEAMLFGSRVTASGLTTGDVGVGASSPGGALGSRIDFTSFYVKQVKWESEPVTDEQKQTP